MTSQILSAMGNRTLTARKIADAIGENPDDVFKTLMVMRADGLVKTMQPGPGNPVGWVAVGGVR